MLIRRLTEEDAVPFWDLRLRALRDHPDAFGSSYAQALLQPADAAAARLRYDPDAPHNFVLGAFDPDLCGMVGFYQTTGLKERHKGSIWGMYVTAESTGRGIGRALMEQAIAEARCYPGIEQIILTVTTSNQRARQLYLSLGFTVYGLEPRALKLDDIYLDEELMILDLR